ncbi:guanine nucleotide exchange factor synembryn domain-containing protein [Apiospora aurea]|uniref:Guanine nucleotide exchange factor synembryn domain-containing protein n=1 Tax=Apiospora aurea TaxID=335848 RepID=A0ABR1QXS0_9PEZI
MSQQSSQERPGRLKRLFSHQNGPFSSLKSTSDVKEAGMAQPTPQPAMGNLIGPEKLAAVTELVSKLSNDLEAICLLPDQRDAALEELKIYGRNPQNADPIFTKEGIETLARHAFHSPSSKTSRNALRCLCNAMLLKPDTRQMFVDLGFESKACSQLKNDNRDNEFLISRVIFLTTYDTNVDIEALVDKHNIAAIIAKNLERHAKRSTTPEPPSDAMQEVALVETLKLLFNITHYCKDRTSSFTPCIPHIVVLLCHSTIGSSRPLDPPIGTLVNALLNLDLGDKDIQAALFPQEENNVLAVRLVELLNLSRKSYGNEELENTVTALVGVLRAIHEYAPEEMKAWVRGQLLPTEADRNEVLGRSSTLPSWLLSNSTNPVTPQFREAISNLLFDMSDRDATKFVDNVGYGFASGFLFNRNLPIPQNAQEAFANAGGREVNPITGQFLDAEKHPVVPEMAEEEKEREAERLYVLFERLRANGLITAENPVRTAQQSGRFEELPDDYEEDVD